MPGTWANEQALVLDTSDGSDVYYSLVSSDPLASGFAYDGPVVLESTGAVTVYISAVGKDGVRTDYTVSYTVQPETPVISTESASIFLANITNSPIRKYVSGTIFTIPTELKYGMGTYLPTIDGKTFTLSAFNKLERYVPCTVTDGQNFWRFIIHTVAAASEQPEIQTVPFSINDWDTFTYTGQKLIYQIDDNYWSADRKPVKLDRSVSHVIRWQSIEYEFGNPIQEYLLPAKPELVMQKNTAGNISFSIPVDTGYQLGATDKRCAAGRIASGLFSSVTIDTFDGDAITGPMELGVYYQNVYQGTLTANFVIDKQPPENPVIASSSKVSYARNMVTLTISSNDNSKVYYTISKPLESDTGFEGTDQKTFDEVAVGKYNAYDGKPIILKSKSDRAAFYKVNAYAVDEAGNTSGITEYRIVVDEYNYYLSLDGKKFNKDSAMEIEPDGSYGNPFTTFSQAVNAINKMPYTRLHVSGNITLDDKQYTITSSCKIVGNNNHIIIPQNSVIRVKNVLFEAEKCVFEKQVKVGASQQYLTDEQTEIIQKMFIVENGDVKFSGCELVGVFGSDAILVDAKSSNVQIENCGLTVQADTYACALSQNDCMTTIKNSRITSVAAMCVCLSVHKGKITLSDSTCRVIGKLGRDIELVQSDAKITNNILGATLSTKTKDVTAIWKDVDSTLVQKDNSESGF